MKINKHAGFWIRLMALLIDVIIFVVISISSSLLIINAQEFKLWDQQLIYMVNTNWTYYLWFLIPISLLIIQFLLIPLLTKGKTIGQLIFQIKVASFSENHWKSVIFKRWQLGALIWILVMIMFMVLVNPTTINKVSLYTFIQNHQKEFKALDPDQQSQIINAYQLNSWETALLAILATTSSFNIMAQMLLLISISIKPNKIGLLDRLTASKVIYLKKFLIEKQIKLIIIKPKLNQKNEIIWKN